MNLARSSTACVALAAIVASAPAQFVFPAAQASAPGNAVMNAPFSAFAGQPNGATRCMVILDPAAVPFPVGTSVFRVAFRRDTAYPSTAYGAFNGSLQVRMGSAIAVPDGVQDVRFARLWNGNPTIVFNATGSSFAVPAAPAPGTSLPPWSVVANFTTPYQWNGGPLAIEFLWTPAGGSSSWRCDAFTTTRGNGTFRSLGQGCTGSNGYRPFHYPLPETTVPGGMLTLQMEGSIRPTTPGTLQDLSMHILGFAALPAPVDLGPLLGTPSGCFLRNDAVLTSLAPIANSSALFGRAVHQVALPASAALGGANLYSQWLLFDLGVNAAFPATVSDGIEITLGQLPPPAAPRRARTLWKFGATGFDIDSGKMAADEYGPVLRFN